MRHHIYSFVLALGLLCGYSDRASASSCEVLERIAKRACESSSDVVLIVHEGKVVGCFGERKAYTPMDTRSITKSFLSLATGMLLQEPNFTGIDTPIYSYYPEWQQGMKKDVTIRHLLNHTSGLQTNDDACSFYSFPNVIQMALVSDFVNYPGNSFKYNNKATNLLAGVIQRASGRSVHEYLKGRLFSPLGINSDTWLCDPAGNNFGMSHLMMNAMDLAKVGMLIAENGSWQNFQYIPKAWIDYMKTPSQTFTPFYGALVWLGYRTLDLYWEQPLLDCYRASGIPENYVQALEFLQGRVLHLEGDVTYGNFRLLCACQLSSIFGTVEAVDDFFQRVESIGLPIGSWKEGHLLTVAARGYLGQQLIVFPDDKLVGVRLTSTCTSHEGADTFSDFEALLDELIYQMNLERAMQACQ